MTMSWSDSLTESTTRPTRPTRPSYVPPHQRNHNGFTLTPSEFTAESFSSPGSRFMNRSGYYELGRTGPSRVRAPRGRGVGRGRGRSWGRYNNMYDPNPNPNPNPILHPNPFDIAEKFNELEVVDDTGGLGGINFDAYEDIPVEASGSDVPQPVESFAEIDLGKGLNDNIKRCKYVKPTPVQRHAIPIAMGGRDLMACAQTGSGKTAAFCFPIISGIQRNHAMKPLLSRGGVAYPLALILSPTRELSIQIHDEAKKFSYQTGVKVVVAYGGAPILQQLRNLEMGVDILVATPGRLVDMIERSRVSLRRIKYLALDEADRMLDMGFEPQIRKIVEQMGMPPPGARQTLLFSATFPAEIQRLASDFLSNYIFLTVGRVGSSTDLIVQKVEFVPDMDKRNLLMNLLHAQRENGTLGKHALTLVFVETKKGADALEHWLSMNGFPATAIHGDKVQMERTRALKMFKSGVTPILVATDVAARGLDIPHVAHVINFDLPRDVDDYVHRIGRTGRAGKSGLATAFFSDKNMPIAKALAELMEEANQEVPQWLIQYAETTSYGGGGQARRHKENNFGSNDFRSGAQLRNVNDYNSSPYADAERYAVTSDAYPASVSADYYNAVSADYYNAANAEPFTATGWD
ncbi:DEAD-box ATP-dependent RNA helicase 52C-like [Cornus florida]|uniref:DEAD-box ATP-dependent RNA helicase 52C-like n=1 Tax=Cornus florida TaxID=4283 RepID=UPI0028A06F78|nr:DEAD-box ATP-dependent RNA helicase 52C-like [Cornus florida]